MKAAPLLDMAKDVPPLQSLADQYQRAHQECCSLAQRIIDNKVRLLKSAHNDLPEVMLRADLMKHRYCLCAVANEILATEN